MLQLRVVSPVDRTSAVLDALMADPAAVNVAVVRGAAQDPPGDLIFCDIAREGANQIIATLRTLGVHQHGSLTLDSIDVSVSDVAAAAEARIRGHGSDAAVWEEVDARVRDESLLTAGFLALLMIAATIATIGLVEDSPVLIVGAMVVGPEFGPIAGLSVGLFKRRVNRVRTALVTLTVGFTAGALAAASATLAMRASGAIPEGFSPHGQELTGFVLEPSSLAFAVSLLAGAAGTLSLTQAKAGVLIGVLISVTTIPADAAIGLSAALGAWQDVKGAAAQLGLNVAGLVLAGVVTLWVQRASWERLLRRHPPDST